MNCQPLSLCFSWIPYCPRYVPIYCECGHLLIKLQEQNGLTFFHFSEQQCQLFTIVIHSYTDTQLCISLAAKEGSGTVPLLELFFSPEILGNMNMQILRS